MAVPQVSADGTQVSASGSINRQINYQGKLFNASGAVVSDGSYQMGFSLYDASSAGNRLWSASGTLSVPTKIPVTVTNGLFTVLLGDTSAAGGWQNDFSTSTIWDSSSLYIGVTVGSDSEMTPRKRVGAVPQAFNAAQLQGMSASGTAEGRSSLFVINRTETAATSDPRSALDVRTSGADNTNDYIARFQSQTGSSITDAFTIRRDGYVSAGQMRIAPSGGTVGASVHATSQDGTDNAWGGHFDKLLVGRGFGAAFVTGANSFAQMIRYSSTSKTGLCLDDIDNGTSCTFTAGVSIKAEGAINASAFNVGSFDLAEMYSITGEVEPGDLLVVDPEQPMFVKRSSGKAYDEHLVGIVSTKPGFILGEITSGTRVALAGRVPTKVSMVNGPIAVGDVLTSSPIPGVAMKATAPGRVVGYALEATSTAGVIEVFVKVGYDAGSFLHAEGSEVVAAGNLVMNPTRVATADTPTADSWGMTWRGSVWDGLQAIKKDFRLFNDSVSGATSTFRLQMGSSTVWSVDEMGSMQTSGELYLGGRFFPATRTGAQSDKYVFLDDTGPASSTYIATNADGWQANTSYDFAERYYSPDALEPGDVVVLSQRGRFHVQRTMQASDVPVGIVSTKPAFVAGAPEPSTFPIALAGRVPTHVSAINGPIKIGDPLAASSLPGVVMKAIQAGPIVGYALEEYTSANVGKIEVFVNAGWWGGSAIVMNESASEKVGLISTPTAPAIVLPKSYQGVARILAGATKVKVVHPSLGTFPLIQVTPYGKVDTQWWTDNSSDRGFEIFLKEPLTQDVTFSWRAEEMLLADNQLFLSNDQPAQWDIHTGQPVLPAGQPQPTNQAETLPDVTSATTTNETTLTATTTEAIAPEPTPEPELIVPAISTPDSSGNIPASEAEQEVIETIPAADPIPASVPVIPVPAEPAA